MPGQPGTDGWSLTDNLDTPRYIVSDSSAVVDHVMSEAFGEVTGESNPSIAHWAGFAGGHVDAFTSLVNDYHRWYDPAYGKWLSADPIGFSAGDRDLSRYASNAPTDRVDRTGEIVPVVVGVVVITYWFWPNNLNAPGPGDPTYPSNPDAGIPYAAGAGILAGLAAEAIAQAAAQAAAKAAAAAAVAEAEAAAAAEIVAGAEAAVSAVEAAEFEAGIVEAQALANAELGNINGVINAAKAELAAAEAAGNSSKIAMLDQLITELNGIADELWWFIGGFN